MSEKEDDLLEGLEGDVFGDSEEIEELDADFDYDAILSQLQSEDPDFLKSLEEVPEDTTEESSLEDADLMDILSGMPEDEELAGIQELLAADEQNEILEPKENEENAAFNPQAAIEAEASKGKKKEKSEGFLHKLADVLFTEEKVEVPEEEQLKLSKENEKVLKEVARAEKKKEKLEKKNEKKAQKEQKKQLKLQKKEEKKKAQEEKKAQEPEEKTRPLSKKMSALIFAAAASGLALVFLGTNAVGYTGIISRAKEYMGKGDYVEAYRQLEDAKVKKGDSNLYDKTRLTAYVAKELNSYDVFYNQKMYAEALDALINAAGRQKRYSKEAASVGADVEFETMYAEIEESLKKEFKMSVEDALELFDMMDREEYTKELYKILEKLGLAE